MPKRFMIALYNNNFGLVTRGLEEHGLTTRGVRPLSDENSRFLVATLGIASAMSKQNRLSEELKLEIIERAAGHVDIFKLVKGLIACAGIDRVHYGSAINIFKVPGRICDALELNVYSVEAAVAIQRLDPETSKSLLVFIDEKDRVKLLSCKFSITIAHLAHKNMLVSDDDLFTIFAGNICKPYYVG